MCEQRKPPKRMRSNQSPPGAKALASLLCTLVLTLSPAARLSVAAQSAAAQTESKLIVSQTTAAGFRLERLTVAGGAELLTIFGSLDGLSHRDAQSQDVPLVSVLRDTLGDAVSENDRLRYLWMLTYTKPTFKQRAAAAIPFLYKRVDNKRRASKNDPPPALLDLSATDSEMWNNFFWSALQTIFFDSYTIPLKAATRTFRRNTNDYRTSHLVRALAILSLYEAAHGEGTPVFSATEMHEIQARLMLSQKTLGGLMDDIYLQRVFQKQLSAARDVRGQNWELLRQRAEAESLYFEPLELPDGSATHAMLWVAASDVKQNRDRPFESRFLNIASPWKDKRLQSWEGYTETRYFDAENRAVAPDTQGARRVQLIPLALYGLDHPKIPALLVDFRDQLNPKKREMSRRVLEDAARNVLSLSQFGDLPYFLGRSIYDFVTRRRGMDVNQPTRLRTYSQLKLLLSLSASLNSELREEIAHRMDSVSLNPMENDYLAEAQLARDQYAALVAYARRPDGLPARLDRDRRAEMTPLTHGRAEQVLFRVANILSFGRYVHREETSPELLSRMELKRRLNSHERYLRDVAKTSQQVEVEWDIREVRRSLRFVAENGAAAGQKTVRAAARIFALTADDETRLLCLEALYHVNNETAKNNLLRIYRDQNIDVRWRDLSVQYLRRAVREEQRIAPSDARVILTLVGQEQ